MDYYDALERLKASKALCHPARIASKYERRSYWTDYRTDHYMVRLPIVEIH